MLRQKDLEQLNANFKSQKNLWLLMLVAPFIYLFLGYLIGPLWTDRTWGGDWMLPFMRATLAVLAMLNVFVCWQARRLTLAGRPWRLILRIERRLAAAAPDQLHPAARLYQALQVFTLGLAESIALLGLVLFILGDGLVMLFFFANAAVVVLIMFRPRMVELIGIAGRLLSGQIKLDSRPTAS
ncbi:hypothetical protein [Geoalkalibacter halelectricus]|uniref:Uncharacterized protein n=1 Tax=Geoalkalibacter halelectricus TaxID=2847045 RepID=A0ABY5ZP50_9BACT|nr:hypothetical protein [Geoalkalibacter halelectricus]MDO3379972.1 hypothetical protein [Geoalkalibacter halelectricus]UWZ80501.1 hypothetical protein L9S41_03655 [Geoalkalibacter halelectricus]